MRACTPITLQQKTDGASRRFEAVTGRAVRSTGTGLLPSNYVSNPQVGNSSDMLLALAHDSGGIDAETAKAFATLIVRPARTGHSVLADAPERLESIYDIWLESAALTDNLMVANRATMSEVAEARRLYLTDARDDILRTLDVIPGKAAMSKAAKINLGYMGLLRESYMIAPARVGAAGTMDAIGNAWFQSITGHIGSAFNTLNPKHQLAFARHTMKGTELSHPTVDLLNNLGTSVPQGITDTLTRDLFDVAKETNWANLLSVGGRFKPGQAASRVLASKWGRAWRHGIDMNARLSLFGDTLGREMKQVRMTLYRQFRADYGDDLAQNIIDDLGRNTDFSTTHLNEVLTRHGIDEHDQIARSYRQSITDAKAVAKREVERVHFKGAMTNADEAARHVMLFHFWASRAMLFYPKTVLGNPWLLYNHVQVYDRLQEEAERTGAGNVMNMYFTWQADQGWFFQFDPISYIIPYTMIRDAATSYSGEKAVDEWVRRFGTFVNPAIMAGLTAIGVSEAFPSLTGTNATRNAIKAVLNWDRNNGYNLFSDTYGMTGDIVTTIETRIMDGINNQLHEWFPDFVDDVEPFDPTANDMVIVKDIIIRNAEEDFDMTYEEMIANPDTRYIDEVNRALIAADTGQPNDRAEEAFAEWSRWDQEVQAVVRAVVPGYVPVKSQTTADRAEANREDDPNAGAITDAVYSGSPQATQLNTENAQYQALGTEWEQGMYQGWTTIAYGDLQPYNVQVIGGREYTGAEVMAMSEDERLDLADQWVKDNLHHQYPDEPVNGVQLNPYQGFLDERKGFVESHPDLAGYKNFQKGLRDYSDPVYGTGERAARQYLEAVSPEFAQEIDKYRQVLVGQGLAPEEIEDRLDGWARSESGYNAYRGVKNRVGDMDPLSTFDASQALPPLTSATTTEQSGSAPPADSTQSPEGESQRPKWQRDLLVEWDEYEQALADLEAEYGPLSGYSNGLGAQEIQQLLPDASRNLKQFLNWAREQEAAGLPSDIDSYLDYRDAQYEANK